MRSLLDRPNAFSRFNTDEVSVRGVSDARRHIAARPKCCVFDCGFEDAMADGDVEANVRKYEILFPLKDWPFPEQPQIGDIAEIDGVQYLVYEVSRRIGDWCLAVRQTKGGVA